MNAKVIKAFGDKNDRNRLYMPGDSYEADAARIAELQSGGFVEKVAERKQPVRKRAAKPKE